MLACGTGTVFGCQGVDFVVGELSEVYLDPVSSVKLGDDLSIELY